MNKHVFIPLLTIILFAGPSAATAGDLKGDIAEHMYFRRTSAATQMTPERKAFQAEVNQRATQMQEDVRVMRLRDALRLRTSTENYAYADAIEEVENVISGLTTEKEVTQWMGAPQETVHADIVPWSTTKGRIAYHINRDYYPVPAWNQKVIAKKLHYTEKNTPREGLSLEVLFTVNKDTGRIDYRQYYFGTGDILPAWKVNVITNG